MMDLSLHRDRAVIRTPFSATHDLVQAFSGLGESGAADQNPVDYAWAALVKRSCRDIWHADQVLALSTDEAPPMLVNGADIGGNHAQECAVRVDAGPDGWAFSDIGSLWRDAQGIAWTCIRVLSPRHALFVPENAGPSETDYVFPPAVSGCLSAADGRRLSAAGQQTGVPMTRSIRSVSRALFARKNSVWQPVTGDLTDCEEARIEECYDIINPATVADGLRRRRPPMGYVSNPDLAAFGAPMLRVRNRFALRPDGTVVVSFRHEALQPVAWQGFLALMYQEKCCPPGGSVRRCIPGLKPLRQGNRRWDFSLPVDIARPFPDAFSLTRESWAQPHRPPERVIEQIRDRKGACVAFAAGILPLADGRPEARARDLKEALTLTASRKTYLTFCGTGNPAAASQDGPLFTRREGAVYRTYYPAAPGASLYTVSSEEGLFLYVDFMAPGSSPALRREYPCPAGCHFRLIHQSGDMQWTKEQGMLRFSGRRGQAAFVFPAAGQLQNMPK